jgi:hypothetical protein
VYAVKDVVVFDGLCEETLAYTCTLYKDDRKIGTAQSRGNGSAVMFRVDRDEMRKFSEYTDSLPPMEIEGYQCKVSPELLVNLLIEADRA